MKTIRTALTILAAFSCATAHATIYTVINNNDSGGGSLRQAINFANADAADDSIVFNIPGSQVHTINLQSELPPLLDAFTTMNCFTQPNPATNPFPIVISGSAVGLNARGLVIQTSFSLVQGLFITGFADSGVLITSNQIGNTIAGCFIAGNGHSGIEIEGSINSVIGNTITANGDEGVFVANGQTRNRITMNSIFDNGPLADTNALGIDLAPGGVTANDNCDDDTGANTLQDFPVLTTATSDGFTTTITGTLDSTASRLFIIEFFANASCDASGFGEGETYLGSTNVTTDAACNAPISAILPVGLADGVFITATATDGNFGNTSEFSQCLQLTGFTANHPPTATNDVYTTDQDTPLNVPAPGVLSNDTDLDGAALTAVQTTTGLHGTGTINANGSLAYSPDPGFSGVDVLTYHANDGTNDSANAVAIISIGADTPTGSVVNVQLDAIVAGVSVTFADVTAPGSTTVVPIDPTQAGTPPGDFTIFSDLTFDVTTTANVTAPIEVCFTLTGPINAGTFAFLRVLHNEGGLLVDRTILPPDSPAPDFATLTLCARVNSLSPFAIALFEPTPHDFAVTTLKAPKKVTLKTGVAPKASKIQVAIKNIGPTTETLSNAGSINALVNLDIESLGICAVPVATLVPPKKFPVVLAPKKSLKLTYLVTIDCANDPLANSKTDTGHEDYRYTVTVDHSALDGEPDTVSSNDTCPRAPSGSDKGCGNKDPVTKLLGADILTDVVQKP